MIARPLLSLVLLAAAGGDREILVERVTGSEPMKLNVRCESASARELLASVARVAGLRVGPLPEEFRGTVGPVGLRAVSPARAVEALAGALGFAARVESGNATIERVPEPNEPGARAWYRDRAKEQFEEFLAYEWDHSRAPRAWIELALLHEEAGDYGAAIGALESLRESRPESAEAVEALVHIGRVEVTREHYDDAIESLSRVVDKHANHRACAEAYALLGRAKLETGQVDTARRYLKLAVDRFPGAASTRSARIWRAEVLRATGQWEKAWVEVEQLEHEELSLAQAYELLEVRARLAESTGRWQEAAEGWLALASREPFVPRRARQLSSAREAARRADDRLTELAVRAIQAGDRKREEVGLWLVDQGLPEAALHYLSNDSGVKLRAALDLAERGDVADARDLLGATPIEPAWVPIRKLVEAEIAIRGGDPAEVPRLLGAAIESSADESFVNAALQKLGDAYLALGDYVRAEKCFQGIVPKEDRP